MKKPLCPKCRHLIEHHTAGGCTRDRSTPGGHVYSCDCEEEHKDRLPVLTKAQRVVLIMLLTDSRETTKNAHHSFISGRVAATLMLRGLAKYVYETRTDGGATQRVGITDAGRAALGEKP